jgi:hypothetical protein
MGLWFLGSVLLKNLPDNLSIDLVIDNQASAPFRRAVRKTFQRQVEYSLHFSPPLYSNQLREGLRRGWHLPRRYKLLCAGMKKELGYHLNPADLPQE